MLLIGPNNHYPATTADIKVDHPDWTEGQPLPEGWHEVERAEMPEFDRTTQRLDENFPVEKDGKFYQDIFVREYTAEEIERRDAPKTARQKLKDLGLTEVEINSLLKGLI